MSHSRNPLAFPPEAKWLRPEERRSGGIVSPHMLGVRTGIARTRVRSPEAVMRCLPVTALKTAGANAACGGAAGVVENGTLGFAERDLCRGGRLAEDVHQYIRHDRSADGDQHQIGPADVPFVARVLG